MSTGIFIELTEDQLLGVAGQKVGDGGGGGEAPTEDVWTYKQTFGVEPIASYKRTPVFTFPSPSMVITGSLDKGDLGKKFGCSEAYSGSGAKTCKMTTNGIKVSEKNVGTGQMFQFVIEQKHLGDFEIAYWQQAPTKPFKTELETYAK